MKWLLYIIIFLIAIWIIECLSDINTNSDYYSLKKFKDLNLVEKATVITATLAYIIVLIFIVIIAYKLCYSLIINL